MASFMKEFEHLEIQLEDIKSATNNFDESKVIGTGGFGKVYAGELSHSKGRGMVALKRLDRKHGQGDPQFWKEIMMLSRYTHENLISLLGFCNKKGEMILVYEHASRGSLERYLNDATLTWTQRIKICLDAANGLSFLHEPNERQQRVLHCDIKSANILLGENLNAKISDFGLSKMGSTGQQYSFMITNAVGTLGYCDPLYIETYQLTKESDVYSFGVVLFEVLSGKLCVENIRGQLKVYVPYWKQSYEEEKLERIVLEDIKQQMNQSSLEIFAGIAYQCLQKSREERPTMSLVVEKLEIALQMQMLPKEYVEIANAAVDPLLFRSLEEFKELLSKGVLLNGGKTMLSLNDKEEYHVMVSIEEYLSLDDPNRDYSDRYSSKQKSRYAVGCYKTHLMEFKLRVTAPLFLSPDVTYGLNLIFHASEKKRMKQQYVGFRYKIQGETKISILHYADKNERKQLAAELYQFNSTEESIIDLEILLEDCGLSGAFYIEGIEFHPLEKVERQVVIANQEIVRGVVFYRFTEESEVLLSQGVLLNGGKTWLSITENGERIERIYITGCLNPNKIEYYNSHNSDEDLDEIVYGLKYPSGDIVNSRFPWRGYYEYKSKFKAHVRGQYLTPQILYTINLVFRYGWQSNVDKCQPLRYKVDGEETKVFIIYPTDMRQDGWFIAPLYHFRSQHKTADLQFEFEQRSISLQVVGIEFQPSEEKVELQVFEEYQDIVEVASQSLFYTSLDELKQILSKGVHLNGYKTWFSLNEKGQHCHMISMKDCLISNEDSTSRYVSDFWSRFPAGLYQTNDKAFKTHVKTQLLSPSIIYTVNLVFYASSYGDQAYVDLKYRLSGEPTTSTVYLANKRKDDRMYMAELYQFTSDGSIVDLEIMFDNCETYIGALEGILFQPLEIVSWQIPVNKIRLGREQAEDPMFEDDKVVDTKTIPDSGILKLSSDTEKWTMKKNLYSCLVKLFQFNNDTAQEWSYLDKNEKKCLMLSARASCLRMEGQSTWCSLPESRFGKVLVITATKKIQIKREIKPELVSPKTKYAAYLVYKLPQDQSTFEAPMEVVEDNLPRYRFIYLVSPPHTPVIGQNYGVNSYNPLNRYKGNAIPQQRSGGWMEVKVREFQTTSEMIYMHLELQHPGTKNLKGLMVQGIEIRPI